LKKSTPWYGFMTVPVLSARVWIAPQR